MVDTPKKPLTNGAEAPGQFPTWSPNETDRAVEQALKLRPGLFESLHKMPLLKTLGSHLRKRETDLTASTAERPAPPQGFEGPMSGEGKI